MVGDSVLIEHGRTPGTITALIESKEDQLSFNVAGPGIMISSEPFGLVFWSVPNQFNDPVTKAN